ncbi:putative non-specific serine/threonine protein kinase [Helianthus annuus]|nr:putative non-specific serine/threonine protein kinase [Helianthus annuus]
MLASVGSGSSGSPVIKSGNMNISVEVLKQCDQNFAKESELGHGGFGVIYKGQLVIRWNKSSSQKNGIWCDLQQSIR